MSISRMSSTSFRPLFSSLFSKPEATAAQKKDLEESTEVRATNPWGDEQVYEVPSRGFLRRDDHGAPITFFEDGTPVDSVQKP